MKVRAWLVTAVAAALGAAVLGCDDAIITGNVALHVTVDSAAPITQVGYEITHDGTIEVKGKLVTDAPARSFSKLISHVPPAKAYQAHVSAQSADGTITCDASTTFDVRASATTPVSLGLGCHGTNDGMVVISVGISCPGFQVSSLTVSPLAASVGSPINVGANASGLDGGVTSYSWTATAGAFAAPTASHTIYSCAAPGTATLTVTAVNDVCRDSQSVMIQCLSDGGAGDAAGP